MHWFSNLYLKLFPINAFIQKFMEEWNSFQLLLQCDKNAQERQIQNMRQIFWSDKTAFYNYWTKRSLNKIHLSWKTMFFFADEIWDNSFILNIKYSQPTLFCRGMNHFHYNCCLFRINILCSQNFRCKHASCSIVFFLFKTS